MFGKAGSMVLSCICCSLCFADALTLSDNSKARSTVVVAEDGPVYEKHAAKELADFLSQVIVDELKVKGLDYHGRGSRLLVGAKAAKLADKNFSLEGTKPETVIIRTVGNDIIIAGEGTRGTLYAVYTFLGDVVGCRWWTATESTIPRKKTLVIPRQDYQYSPRIVFRRPYWSFAIDDVNWCVRNMVNAPAVSKLNPKFGTVPGEVGGCHNYYEFLSPEKYFDKHPEWYSEVGGKRLKSGGQLCVTNPAMTREYAKNVLKTIDPEKGRMGRDLEVWVAQNDWGNYCQCKTCSLLNEKENSPAAGVLYFANNIAKAVAKEYPGVMIKTFAYDWSQKPPRTITADPNVIVQLCTTDCSYFQAYDDRQSHNAHFGDTIRAWSRKADTLYAWDYPINISAYMAPYPNLRIQSRNIKFLADNNVRGMFANANWDSGSSCAEFGHLRAWTTARLYWNPSLDGDMLIQEFVYGYYGNAGKYIEQYINLTHDIVERDKIPSHGMGAYPGGREFTSFEVLNKGLGLLKQAKQAVKDNHPLVNRVEVVELQMLYMFLLDWDALRFEAEQKRETWPLDEDIKAVYDHLMEIMKRNHATKFSENNLRGWWPFIEKRVKFGDPGTAPKGLENVSPRYWQSVQDRYFEVSNPKTCTTGVKDSLASDGFAAKAIAADGQQILSTPVQPIPILSYARTIRNKPVELYVSVRCEMDKTDGDILTIQPGNKDAFTLSADRIKGNGYYDYLIGKYDSLGGWTRIEIKMADNPNVKEIWIDRLWIKIIEDNNEIKDTIKDHEAIQQ